MLLRLVSFLLIQGLGAVIGAWVAPQQLQVRGVLGGMLVAGLLWELLAFSRGGLTLRTMIFVAPSFSTCS